MITRYYKLQDSSWYNLFGYDGILWPLFAFAARQLQLVETSHGRWRPSEPSRDEKDVPHVTKTPLAEWRMSESIQKIYGTTCMSQDTIFNI